MGTWVGGPEVVQLLSHFVFFVRVMGRGISFPLRVAAEIKSCPSSDLKNPSSLLLTSSVLSRDNGIGKKGECFNCAHCFGHCWAARDARGEGQVGLLSCLACLCCCRLYAKFPDHFIFLKKTLGLSFSMLPTGQRPHDEGLQTIGCRTWLR